MSVADVFITKQLARGWFDPHGQMAAAYLALATMANGKAYVRVMDPAEKLPPFGLRIVPKLNRKARRARRKP
jgi:hypothetical protein